MQPSHKEVISLRRTRLASTAGHVIMVEPGVPTRIPKELFVVAAQHGCVDYNPAMIEAFKSAMSQATESRNHSAPRVEVDVTRLIRNAVTQVLVAAKEDSTLVTSAGTPRVPAVRAAFNELCVAAGIEADGTKITQDVVATVYESLKQTDEGSESQGTDSVDRYPSSLEGEEVGGLDEDMLERMTADEE